MNAFLFDKYSLANACFIIHEQTFSSWNSMFAIVGVLHRCAVGDQTLSHSRHLSVPHCDKQDYQRITTHDQTAKHMTVNGKI